MFNGSENYNDDYFKPMQKVGATDLNGYDQRGPDQLLRERPCLGPRPRPVDGVGPDGPPQGRHQSGQARQQVGVVQNELRQYYNEPYSVTET